MSERDQAEIDALDYRFSRWTLAFADADVERRFSEGHLKRSLGVIRFGVTAGTLLYVVFGVLDYLIHPTSFVSIWAIRAFVILWLSILLAMSMTQTFMRWSQPMLAFATLMSGLGVIAMTVVGDDPGRHWYYAGVTLIAIYCANLVGLRFRFGAAMAILMLVGYAIAAIWINPAPFLMLTSNLFFLTTAVSAGVFASYAQELYLRRNFIFTELLLQEKHRSDELLHQARAGIRAKDEFLAVMGHELRTPLNAIIGFSEIMKNRLFGPVGARQYESYIEDIHNSGTHLLGVINAILDLTKAQADKLKLHEEDFDPAFLINGCLRMFRETASAKGIRLSFLKPDETMQAHGDQQLLRQVVVNLVSNAIKFTRTGGGVTVRLEPTPDHGVAIVVEDTGVGIARDDLARVFEPFVQVDQGLNRAHEGAGLGLPLAKKIMELHGGQLELSSEIGVGTKVSAKLPASRVVRVPTFEHVEFSSPQPTVPAAPSTATILPLAASGGGSRPRLEVVGGRAKDPSSTEN